MSPIEILVLSKDNNFVDEIRSVVISLSYTFPTIACADINQLMDRVSTNVPILIVSEMQLSDGLTGANVAHQLVAFDVPILFVTDVDNDDSFKSVQQYFPAAYLVKPISKGILKYTIALILQKHTAPTIEMSNSDILNDPKLIDDVIFVRSNNLLSKILIADILYISTEGNYSIIHTQDKRHVVKVSLTNMKELFDARNFFQVHRSYLVQIDKIDNINLGTNELTLAGQIVPIGRKYKEDLLNALVIIK